ncbi:MAG: hypothetical protein P4L99_17295 [Chthoniobacter sp.]|nr:hypothetical protein [Chthoniobacter sp.]
MLRHKGFLLFVLRLLLAYGVLALPWPGWHAQWARILQVSATWTLTPSQGPAEITFEARPVSKWSSSLRTTIVNRDLMNRDGSGPVRNFEVRVDQLEVSPIALFLALILATPGTWRKRAWQIPIGLLILQAATLGFLAICIWQESIVVLLASSSAGMQHAAAIVRTALADYQGLLLPILLWLIFNFRRGASLLSLPPRQPGSWTATDQSPQRDPSPSRL